MFGLLLRALADFITHHYGADRWEQVSSAAGKTLDEFEPLMPFNDTLFFRTVLLACDQTQQSPEALLEALGAWIVEGPHEGKVRGLLRFGGKTFRRFLFSLSELPDRLQLVLPFVELPQIEVEQQGEDSFRVVLPGLRLESGWMLRGGLEAMARVYGEEVRLRTLELEGGVGFALDLLAPESTPRSNLSPAGKAAAPWGGRLLTLSETNLSAAVPLYFLMDGQGGISGASTLLERVVGEGPLMGRRFAEVFETSGRFEGGAAIGGDRPAARAAVRLRVRANGYRLRGICLPLALGDDVLVMLSFGIDSLRAVDELALSEEDFAQTDVAMELQALARASGLIVSGLQQMGTRLETAKRTALAEASTDALTGLQNRRAADLFLSRICQRGAAFSVMMLDLDHFKAINDGFGHMVGDAVLRDVATALRRFTRRKDCVARVGGDEFAVILPDLTNAARLRKLGEDVLQALDAGARGEGAHSTPPVQASVGAVVVEAGHAPRPDDVIAACDRALYRAKEAGRNRFELGSLIAGSGDDTGATPVGSAFERRG